MERRDFLGIAFSSLWAMKLTTEEIQLPQFRKIGHHAGVKLDDGRILQMPHIDYAYEYRDRWCYHTKTLQIKQPVTIVSSVLYDENNEVLSEFNFWTHVSLIPEDKLSVTLSGSQGYGHVFIIPKNREDPLPKRLQDRRILGLSNWPMKVHP